MTSELKWVSRSAPRTGHVEWECRWSGAPDVDVSVTVDENTGQAIEYHNGAASKAAVKRHEKGEAPILTNDQATAAVDRLRHDLARLNIAFPGDWRREKSQWERRPWITNKAGEQYPQWRLELRRYEQEHPVQWGYLWASIEMYTGKVTDWRYDNSAILILPQGPSLPQAQVRQIAINAFLQWAGPSLRSDDPMLPVASEFASSKWTPLAYDTVISRLMHRFVFRLPEIRGANAAKPARFAQEIWVDVDGETGKLWSISRNRLKDDQELTNIGVVDFGARLSLCGSLLNAETPPPLAMALAGGTPETVVAAPEPKSSDITLFDFRLSSAPPGQETPAEVSFAYDGAKRLLLWRGYRKRTAGRWFGLRLNEMQGGDLARWIATRATAGKKDQP